MAGHDPDAGEKFPRNGRAAFSGRESLCAHELVAHVQKLGGEIGERNLARYPQLLAAAQYIESQLTRSRLESAARHLRGAGQKLLTTWKQS